jgi:hypothetical protein
MPGSARFGATVPNIYGAYLNETPQHRNLVKRAVLAVTTNASGVATANFNARLILDATATVTASAVTATFTYATISSITATAVSVVSVNGSASGNALAGTIAVTVVADFY